MLSSLTVSRTEKVKNSLFEREREYENKRRTWRKSFETVIRDLSEHRDKRK